MAGAVGERTFEDWYAGVEPRLGRTVAGLVGDRELARDLTAEALARALERWPRISAEVHDPDAWVFRVAINLARRSWRRRLRPAPVPVEGAARSAPPDQPGRDLDLWAAVDALPGRQRQVVVLRYVGDLTEPQIAAVVGTSTGAVSATLTKARAALRSRLQDSHGNGHA